MNQPLAVTTAGGVPEAGARQAVGEVAAIVEGIAPVALAGDGAGLADRQAGCQRGDDFGRGGVDVDLRVRGQQRHGALQFVAHGGIQAERGAQFLHAARQRRAGGLRGAAGASAGCAGGWPMATMSMMRGASVSGRRSRPSSRSSTCSSAGCGTRRAPGCTGCTCPVRPPARRRTRPRARRRDARCACPGWGGPDLVLAVTASRLPWSRTTSRAQSMPPASMRPAGATARSPAGARWRSGAGTGWWSAPPRWRR